MALGKLATGSTLWTMGGMLAANGMITGGGPADPQLRQQKMGSDGKQWQPYSFVVNNADGTKSFISFAKIDPWASFLGMAADFAEMSHHLDEPTRESLAVSMATALANNVSNKTYLKGLTEALALVANGGMNKEKATEMVYYRRVASYIPSYSSLYTGDDEMKEVRSVMDALKSRIPGMSGSVEAKRDMFGQKSEYPDGWLAHAVNPFTAVSQSDDPVRGELSRLASVSSERKFLKVPERIGNIDLTQWRNKSGQSVYDRVMELHGEARLGNRTMWDSMADLIGTRAYQDLMKDGSSLYPDSTRADMLNKIRGNYREASLQKLFKEMPELKAAVDADKRNAILVKMRGPAAAVPLPTPQ